MKTTHRAYAEELGDFRRLANLMTSDNAYMRDHSTWCIGRLVGWKYSLFEHKVATPDFCASNAQLWFDAFGHLAGLAIAEEGDAFFSIITPPGYRFLYEELLDWVLESWGDRGALHTEITEHQTVEIAALERRGFQNASTFYSRRFDLTGPLPERAPLADGFCIVDMATHPDERGQRILRDEAFSNRTGLSEEELTRELLFYNHSRQGPIYHAPTDLCVMAPDGQLVSGCEALIDARNTEADIETVCTHSQFRRRGFARAVILECMYRLRDMGLRNAYIAGYSEAAIALYGSLGHADENRCYVFRLNAG